MEGRDRKKPAGSHESHSRMAAPAARAAKRNGGYQTDEIHMRPADNGGVILRHSRKRKRAGSKAGELGGHEYDQKEYSFGNADDAGEFAKAALADGDAVPDGAPDEADGGEPTGAAGGSDED